MEYIHLNDHWIDCEKEFIFQRFVKVSEIYKLMHDHEYYEFFFIEEGSLVHLINGKKQILKKGDLVFMRPSDKHGFRQHKNHTCILVNIALLESTMKGIIQFLQGSFNVVAFHQQEFPPKFSLNARQRSILNEKFDSLHLISLDNKVHLNSLLKSILIGLLVDNFILKKDIDTSLPDWLRIVEEEMPNPDNFRIGLSRLKEIACKSDEHLSRSFKKFLNCTPTEYVNGLRLNYAASQIKFSDRKIADIALDSGFENLSNFYKQFEKVHNCTPASMRFKY